MVTIRWVAFLLAAECIVALCFIPRSPASAVLALILFVLFLILCWSFGAFAATMSTDSRKVRP